MLKLDHDFRGGQVPAARPQRDAARTLSRLLSQLISYAGNTTKNDENKLVEIRLRKSPDTIQSVTVANIRSGPHRFRLSSLRNSPDSALTLPKSPDMAFRTEYYDGSRLGPALLAPPFSELSSFGLNQSRAVVSVVPGSPGAPTTQRPVKGWRAGVAALPDQNCPSMLDCLRKQRQALLRDAESFTLHYLD
jgi:hypothetical protein